MTGLPNRLAFHTRMEAIGAKRDVKEHSLILMLVDLDKFKEANDTFGHLVGDRVLQQLGDLLRRQVRSVDLVARYGGEEFVVVLPETDKEGAVVFAERMRVAVSEHDFSDGPQRLAATVSIGVAGTPTDGIASPEELLRHADQALYKAKQNGRNQVLVI